MPINALLAVVPNDCSCTLAIREHTYQIYYTESLLLKIIS
jgi:hypothetical protein